MLTQTNEFLSVTFSSGIHNETAVKVSVSLRFNFKISSHNFLKKKNNRPADNVISMEGRKKKNYFLTKYHNPRKILDL